jgi:hypothetical protein
MTCCHICGCFWSNAPHVQIFNPWIVLLDLTGKLKEAGVFLRWLL